MSSSPASFLSCAISRRAAFSVVATLFLVRLLVVVVVLVVVVAAAVSASHSLAKSLTANEAQIVAEFKRIPG